ncbi:MAG: hypothetical protein KDA91_19730 [Planctomycetaceae bacterium]|nr:hypothetical protein [Planctomycetaceae bacterium]
MDETITISRELLSSLVEALGVLTLGRDRNHRFCVSAREAKQLLRGMDGVMSGERVKCNGCGGRGYRSAMSGGHLPYDTVCADCEGRGRVTPEKAKQIEKRHVDWMERTRAS